MREKKVEPATQVKKFIYNYTPVLNRPVLQEFHNSEHTKTERAGFVPMEKRIKAIINAGQKLDKARREQYHYGEGEEINDSHTNFITDTNLDISDIGDIVNTGNLAMEETDRQRKAATKKARAKKDADLKEQIMEATKSVKKMPVPPVVDGEPPQPPADSSLPQTK